MKHDYGEIEEIINRETRAWENQDIDSLLSIFHPDMVWVWPSKSDAHNPMDWGTKLGKFEFDKWKQFYEQFFENNKLVHNIRKIQKIRITSKGDGAFAVVDIDTTWMNKKGKESHWKGRTCKIYVKTEEGWKMTMQTGPLDYSLVKKSD